MIYFLLKKKNENLENLVDKLTQIILNEMGTMKNEKAKTEQYTKTFKSSSSVTLEAVNVSDWTTSIVLLIEDDRSVRICGDYKLTVN